VSSEKLNDTISLPLNSVGRTRVELSNRDRRCFVCKRLIRAGTIHYRLASFVSEERVWGPFVRAHPECGEIYAR